jgi:hypothetical protein
VGNKGEWLVHPDDRARSLAERANVTARQRAYACRKGTPRSHVIPAIPGFLRSGMPRQAAWWANHGYGERAMTAITLDAALTEDSVQKHRFRPTTVLTLDFLGVLYRFHS